MQFITVHHNTLQIQDTTMQCNTLQLQHRWDTIQDTTIQTHYNTAQRKYHTIQLQHTYTYTARHYKYK